MSSVNVTFCATSKSGLGHLARVHHIARAMRNSGHFGQLHLLSNATPAPDVFHSYPGGENPFDEVVITEKSNFANAISKIKPHVAVVDTAVIPGIGRLAAPIVLIMRETRDETLSRFAPTPRQGWDLVIVPNPKAHWTPDNRLLPAQFIQHVGWVYDDLAAPQVSLRKSTEQRNILLCAGGGGNTDWQEWHPRIRQLLGQVSARLDNPVHVTQLLGPRAQPAARVDWVDEVISSISRLDLLMEQFDLVITASGYNTVLELARCTTPALLVPLQRTFDDQRQRAEHWAESLGHLFDPKTMPGAAAWSTDQLQARCRRAKTCLGISGAPAAAALIRQIACNSIASVC